MTPDARIEAEARRNSRRAIDMDYFYPVTISQLAGRTNEYGVHGDDWIVSFGGVSVNFGCHETLAKHVFDVMRTSNG